MNPEDHDIEYGGPENKWTPTLGDSLDIKPESTFPKVKDTYADENLLRELLNQLHRLTSDVIIEMDDRLKYYAIPVSTNQYDDKLSAAHRQEWPRDLGDPPDFVSYPYYKALEYKSSSAASYIRSQYSSALRDIYGITSFDSIGIVRNIQDEGVRIGAFLDNYVGSVVDTSEHRILELFQDWVRQGIENTWSLRRLSSAGEATYILPVEEVRQTSPEEAANSQAIFKTKLNFLNQKIIEDSSTLNKTFFGYSDVFYDQFLGPALQFRVNVSSQLDPLGNTTSLRKEIREAAGTLDTNLQSLITDHLRRNIMFSNTIDSLQNSIVLRDKYRTYIKQLEPIRNSPSLASPGNPGHPTPSYSPTPGEYSYFSDIVTAVSDQKATPDFSSQHNLLDGRLRDDAHPQYLVKSGDTITGDIAMSDGATLDGMRPGGQDGHTHKGLDVDGTLKIQGKDLENLVVGPIKREDVCAPKNVRLIEQQSRVVPPGTTSVNARIAFDTCDPTLMYEIQTALFVPPKETTVEYCVSTLARVSNLVP